jgi:hypothetical protein
MKPIGKYKIIAALCVLFLSSDLVKSLVAVQVYAGPANTGISLQTFYDQLAPYGQWVDYPNYGYVFIPSVAPGFMPYSTAGHWVYNEQYGWTWASDYPWGWATFHYGRWNYDANYGWFWIPDLNWGPAWVAWRSCEGYYGWAPLPWGCNINTGFDGDCGVAAEHWCFVPQEHICELNLGAYFVPRVHYWAFLQHSTIINRMDYDNHGRFGYFRGPDRTEVERYVNHPVNIVAVDQYRHPDNNFNRDDREHYDEHHEMNQERHDNEHHDMNQEGHDDGHHGMNQERHMDNEHQNMQTNQRHNEQNRMDHSPAPQRSVQINNVPRRGYYH